MKRPHVKTKQAVGPYYFDIVRPPGSWVENAKCRGFRTDDFFPDRGVGYPKTLPLLRFCQTCVVREECLDYAIDTRQPGIWGGMNEKQRIIVRNERLRLTEKENL